MVDISITDRNSNQVVVPDSHDLEDATTFIGQLVVGASRLDLEYTIEPSCGCFYPPRPIERSVKPVVCIDILDDLVLHFLPAREVLASMTDAPAEKE